MSSFSGIHWLIVGLIVWALYKFRSGGNERPVRFCKSCGHTGSTDAHTPGNFLIEVVLWLCFIVPGLIYSIWRVSRRTRACAQCGSKDLVPPDSPIALCDPETAWNCSRKSCHHCWH